MLAIKISKEILKDMLRECLKSGEAYGEMDVNPITLYQKNEDAFNPVIGITLSDSGEISTKIRTTYRPDNVEEEDEEIDADDDAHAQSRDARLRNIRSQFKNDLENLLRSFE
jgi:hypothetical protein